MLNTLSQFNTHIINTHTDEGHQPQTRCSHTDFTKIHRLIDEYRNYTDEKCEVGCLFTDAMTVSGVK